MTVEYISNMNPRVDFFPSPSDNKTRKRESGHCPCKWLGLTSPRLPRIHQSHMLIRISRVCTMYALHCDIKRTGVVNLNTRLQSKKKKKKKNQVIYNVYTDMQYIVCDTFVRDKVWKREATRTTFFYILIINTILYSSKSTGFPRTLEGKVERDFFFFFEERGRVSLRVWVGMGSTALKKNPEIVLFFTPHCTRDAARITDRARTAAVLPHSRCKYTCRRTCESRCYRWDLSPGSLPE